MPYLPQSKEHRAWRSPKTFPPTWTTIALNRHPQSPETVSLSAILPSKQEWGNDIRQDCALACTWLGHVLRVDHQVFSSEVVSGFYEPCAAAQSWPRVGEGEDKVGERGDL